MVKKVALAVAGAWLVSAGVAAAAPPSAPTILEPGVDGQLVNAADVHLEADGFADPDGDSHDCTDWEIWTVSPSELVWQAPCADGTSRVHIHLGDGQFVNADELTPDTDYRVLVRFEDSAGEASAWSERPFTTDVAGPPGVPSDVPWAVRQPGFEIDLVASGLRLPVDIAPVLDPGDRPRDPVLYVTELYGAIRVVTRSGALRYYAKDLLNFDPTGVFPGSGEQGLTGIVLDPLSGDLFAGMVYEDASAAGSPKPHYEKVVRFHSEDGGRTAATQTTVLDIPEDQGESHQISNLTIGPDGKLYVHVGDGLSTSRAQNLQSFGGKVLRVNLDGSAPEDNPFYDASDGITARDYVYAYGFRNPFGGAWRADRALYEVENGPSVDRFAKVVRGRNYLWDGTDHSMRQFALYTWAPAHAPVNIAFIQPQTADGSGFPAEKMGHAFVTESGPTYAEGPQHAGKRIVEFAPDAAGRFGAPPETLVEYTGVGRATAAGMATGPDGLYFTDLYKDVEYLSPIDRGAHVWRVRDTTKPVLSKLHVRRNRVSYDASEYATVSGAVRARSGRRVGRRLIDSAKPGRNRFRFKGRLRHRRLEPGRYRLILRARDAAGNRSIRKHVGFRVVAR